MDKRKQQMIETLFNTLKGKDLSQALPVISNWKMQMSQQNISFTAEENELLTQMFLKELSPAQRKQYELLKTFMKKQS